MFSINGIGTSLYGASEIDPVDGSFVATKWFIFVLFPILPLASYRVWRGETTSSWTAFIGMPGASTQYKSIRVPLNWKQVIQTYLAVYGLIGIIALDFMYDPLLLSVWVAVIGLPLFGLYYVFSTGQKLWGYFLVFCILLLAVIVAVNWYLGLM